MNCDDIENLLADYLGDELGLPQRAPFDSHLESCKRCREEVDDLQRMQTELQELPGVSMEYAAEQTLCLEVRRRSGWPARILRAGLRYAAMLAIGVGVGWQLNTVPADPTAGEPNAKQPVIQVVAGDEIHPAWIEAALKVNRRYTNQSSFVRSLAALSAVKSLSQ